MRDRLFDKKKEENKEERKENWQNTLQEILTSTLGKLELTKRERQRETERRSMISDDIKRSVTDVLFFPLPTSGNKMSS